MADYDKVVHIAQKEGSKLLRHEDKKLGSVSWYTKDAMGTIYKAPRDLSRDLEAGFQEEQRRRRQDEAWAEKHAQSLPDRLDSMHIAVKVAACLVALGGAVLALVELA